MEIGQLKVCLDIVSRAVGEQADGPSSLPVDSAADRDALGSLASLLEGLVQQEQRKLDKAARAQALNSEQQQYLAGFGEDAGKSQLLQRRGERIVNGRTPMTPEQARCATLARHETCQLLVPRRLPLRAAVTGRDAAEPAPTAPLGSLHRCHSPQQRLPSASLLPSRTVGIPSHPCSASCACHTLPQPALPSAAETDAACMDVHTHAEGFSWHRGTLGLPMTTTHKGLATRQMRTAVTSWHTLVSDRPLAAPARVRVHMSARAPQRPTSSAAPHTGRLCVQGEAAEVHHEGDHRQ